GFLINDSSFMKPNNNGTAVLGVMNFAGAGNVTGSLTYQIGALRDRAGQTIAVPLTGTYSSNPHGTGSVKIAADALVYAYAMVTADGGQSLQLVMTNCMFGSNGCNFLRIGDQRNRQSRQGSFPQWSLRIPVQQCTEPDWDHKRDEV